MHGKILSFIILLLILTLSSLNAQPKNDFSVSIKFLQTKDAYNQGMIFRGPHLSLQYTRKWHLYKWELAYNPELAAGAVFNRGITGINLDIKLINLSFSYAIIEMEHHKLRIGGNIEAKYRYQVYPDLHSGHLFWATEIGISPVFSYRYSWKKRAINVTFINSILGFTSRTSHYDPYFYSLRFTDFVKLAHQELQFGGLNQYDHTRCHIEYIPDISRIHAIGAGLDYFTIYRSAKFTSLSYYLQWKIIF